MKAGQSRSLNDGDMISFGPFVIIHSENRRRHYFNERQTIESCGLVQERQRLGKPRWQFKVRLFRQGDSTDSRGVSQMVREAWDAMVRCGNGIQQARSVLYVQLSLISTTWSDFLIGNDSGARHAKHHMSHSIPQTTIQKRALRHQSLLHHLSSCPRIPP